jgi:16S rRNA (uracil1498-N3)-methyltransferase
MSERFYVTPLRPGETVELTGAEAHHLARVRRIRGGTRVQLFDGSGTECSAIVREIAHQSVTLTVETRVEVNREMPFALTLACSPAKGERLRWLVEKATELGVSQFVPIITARSSEQARSMRAAKTARWVIEASKQCGRNVLMTVREPLGWDQFLDTVSSNTIRVLADPTGVPLSSMMARPPNQEIALAVGPEGGFTDDELLAARKRDWTIVSLSQRILRVETAVVALVARVVGDR